MPLEPHRGGPASAFTLIELLVVIAIISILAALLVPALRQAQDAALGVGCATRQKNIALRLALYANDHDDRHLPGVVPTTIAWPGLLKWTFDDLQPFEQIGKWYEEHYCPALLKLGYKGNSAPVTGYRSNYAANFDLFRISAPLFTTTVGGANRNLPKTPVRTEISKPSLSAELFDARGFGAPPNRAVGFAHSYHIRAEDPNSSMSFIHGNGSKEWPYRGGTINVLFVDGHVEAISDPGNGNSLPIAIVWKGSDPVDHTWGRLWE